MLPTDLEQMIENEILYSYDDEKSARNSARTIIEAINREIIEQKKQAGMDAIRMIASEEGWEETETHYRNKWNKLQEQF